MPDWIFRNLIGLVFLLASCVASFKTGSLNFVSTHFLILAAYSFLMSELLEIKDKIKWKIYHDSSRSLTPNGR